MDSDDSKEAHYPTRLPLKKKGKKIKKIVKAKKKLPILKSIAEEDSLLESDRN